MKLVLGGDVMIGRSFNELFDNHPSFNIWGDTLNVFNNTDFSIVNLETTLTNSSNKWPNKAFNYKLRPKHASILTQASIDYVNLANNHILDYKKEGLTDTITTLNNLGILHSGAGLNKKEAMLPVITKDLVIFSAANHYDDWAATNKKEGLWYLEPDLLLRYSKKLKEKYPNKIRIFSVHWGPNWGWDVSPSIQSLANRLIRDGGVNIIHGHSHHHVQRMERINDGYVFYSFGDLIDDYAIDSNYKSNLSFLAQFDIKKSKIAGLKILPTKISHRHKNNILYAQVNLVKETENKKWVKQKLLTVDILNTSTPSNIFKYHL